MSPCLRDRIAAAVLLAVALVWIALVWWTIPAGQGARTFPLFFGVLLALLAAAMGAETWREPVAPKPEGEAAAAPMLGEVTAVTATIGSLVVYGALLEPLGFIPSTILVVAAIMIFVLRLRAPLTIAAMAIGLSLGCYLVFGKLLGTYLPPGTWITIYI